MKHIFLLLTFVFSFVFVYAQDVVVPVEQWDCEEVYGSNYHGYNFNEGWKVDFKVENQDGRYSLTNEDIAEVEKLIQKRLAYVNREHENQGGMCPIIDEHIRKYERQYVGFTDADGFRIAWVNFVWDETLPDGKLSEDILTTTGGCGRYWHIKVNIDTKKVYGLEVNEPGDVKYIPRVAPAAPRISRAKYQQENQGIRKTGIIHTDEEKQFD